MSRGRRIVHVLALVALGAAALGACGQKGALYLPQKPPPQAVEPEEGSAPAPDEDDAQ